MLAICEFLFAKMGWDRRKGGEEKKKKKLWKKKKKQLWIKEKKRNFIRSRSCEEKLRIREESFESKRLKRNLPV